MNNLAGLGASFSLDDFGTGYSSFAHIQRLPISIIKIDRRFLQYAHEKEEDASLVKGIIGLAHGLDMRVVAEGAETAEHIRLLKSLNCDQVQGYYFSPPIELGDLCQLVQEDIRLVV
jgi:EAL domain-containing protein (putative c-di-GMP-specific phosphodiesterase class I)